MLATGDHLERYEILGLLGEGGLAQVFAARHATLGTKHALKLLKHPAPGVRDRLVREGRIQASLDDPNVVRVTDVLEHRGAPVLVMELVEGPSLDQVLAQGRLTAGQADHIARGVLAGVAAAHAEGLVHRDLKPGNVLLSVKDGTPVPRVADFGLAKALTPDGAAAATRTGAIMGTPAYMAPEQVRSTRDVDARADVFALGVMLYELFAGVRPYDGETLVALLAAASSGDFPALAERCPDLDPVRVEVIERALEPERGLRFADAGAMRAAWAAAPDLPAASWSAVETMAAPGAPAGGSDTWDDTPVSPAPEPAAPTLAPETAAPPVVSGTLSRPPSRASGRRFGVGAAVVALGAAGLALMWPGRDGGEEGDLDRVPEASVAPVTSTPMDPDLEAASRAVLDRYVPGIEDSRSIRAVDDELGRLAVADLERMLRASRPSRAVIADAVEAAGLPPVAVGIPFAESRLQADVVGALCSAGPWGFVPSTAVENGLRIEDCILRGMEEPWSPSPTDLVGPQAPYVGDGLEDCLIVQCRVDERLDLERATAAGVATLAKVGRLERVADHPLREAALLWGYTMGHGPLLTALGRVPPAGLVEHIFSRKGGRHAATYPARVAANAAAADCLAAPVAERDLALCAQLGWPVRLDDVASDADMRWFIGLQPLDVVSGDPGLASAVALKATRELEAVGARVVEVGAIDSAASAGVDHVVHGSLATIGETLLLNLERTQVESDTVRARVSREVTDPDALAAAIEPMLVELFAQDSALEGSEAIRDVARLTMPQVQGCYEMALKRDRTAGGRVAVEFWIQRSGRTRDAVISEDTIGDPELRDCLLARVEAMLFPVGMEQQVVFPFAMSSK